MTEPRKVFTAADARAIVEARGLSHVKVGAFDIDGILRGKYMSAAKFLSSLESGFGFCDVVLGWDSKDQLYDNVQLTGWHTGYPDTEARMEGIFGMGEKKRAEFGAIFAGAIAEYLKTNPRMSFD